MSDDNVIYVDFKKKRRMEYSEEIQQQIDEINVAAESELLKLRDLLADDYTALDGVMPLPDDGMDHD